MQNGAIVVKVNMGSNKSREYLVCSFSRAEKYKPMQYSMCKTGEKTTTRENIVAILNKYAQIITCLRWVDDRNN